MRSMENNVNAILVVRKAPRGRDFGATMKEETCQMAGFLRTTKDSHLPLNGQ